MAESGTLGGCSVSERIQNTVTQQLTCPICLETYRNPRVLACHHVFCLSCLEALPSHQHEVSCPNCRHITHLEDGGINSLQSAFHIQPLLEIQDTLSRRSSKKCGECGVLGTSCFCRECCSYLCTKCEASHSSQAETCGHFLTSGAELSTLTPSPLQGAHLYCLEHGGRILELYCNTCEQLICCGCIVQTHKEHVFDFVTNVFKQEKERMELHSKLLAQKLEVISKYIEELDEQSTKVSGQHSGVEASINEAAKHLQDTIESRRQELVEQLHGITKPKLENIRMQKEQMKCTKAETRKRIGSIRDCLEAGSEAELLALKKPLMEQTEDVGTEVNSQSLAFLEKADTNFILNGSISQFCSTFGQIYSKYVCAENTSATGEGLLRAVFGQEAVVYADLKDQHGIQMDDATVSVCGELEQYKHSISTDRTLCRAQKKDNGRFELSYVAKFRGACNFHISVNNENIQGSPFQLHVLPSISMLKTPLKIVANLKGPWGITANSNGEILVAEKDGHQISVFNWIEGDFVKVRTIGRKGVLQHQFQRPTGLSIDSNDNILVTDLSYFNVQVSTLDGKTIKSVGTLGSNPLEFSQPVAVGVNPVNQKIYIPDVGNDQVQIINQDLTYHHSIFGSSKANDVLLNSPTDVAFDSAGNVYIVDSGNNRVQVFSVENTYLREFGRKGHRNAQLNVPFSICIDQCDNIYVTEVQRNRVSIFSSKGHFLRGFGCPTIGGHGITVDKAGFVYVANYERRLLQVF